MFRSVFRKKVSEQRHYYAPEGQCAYVIGDIHGCLLPLKRLLDRIEHRATHEHPHLQTQLVFLGDLIDRGPYSAHVVEKLRLYSHPKMSMTFLMGNHEEVFLDVLAGNVRGMIRWFDWGGRDAARSYGVDNLGLLPIDPKQVLFRLQECVPQSHIDFLSSFAPYFVFGDYVFVHAGLRPKVTLDDQKDRDLRWIRDDFLNFQGHFPKKVVHGHTIVDEPQNLHNRISIDTGVYSEGGKLSAVFLVEDKVEFLSESTNLTKTDKTPET